MNKKYNRTVKIQVLIASMAFALSSLFQTTNAYADEYVISDNGAGSSSEIQATNSQNTNVTQNNDAQVSNDVDVNADTGNNQANDNSGNTGISTGDVNSTTTIDNSLNTSVVSNDCCLQPDGTAAINGNGDYSQNTISITSRFGSDTSITNTATITNHIYGQANTGRNTANDNSGNVSIKTGNITVTDTIRNTANTANVHLSQNTNGDYTLSISDNDTDSENTINLSLNNQSNVSVNNTADILSEIFWDANTGNNQANDNRGNVDIQTGDIVFNTTIENNANHATVDLDCCDPQKQEEKPPTVILPPPVLPVSEPTTGGGNGGGDGKSDGKSDGKGGSVLGSTLPTTGNNWLFLALLGNIMMFFFGMFLRLRSGRFPPFALAI